MLTMMVGEGNLDLTCKYLESDVSMLKSTPTEWASLPFEMLDSAAFYLDILSITNPFSHLIVNLKASISYNSQ